MRILNDIQDLLTIMRCRSAENKNQYGRALTILESSVRKRSSYSQFMAVYRLKLMLFGNDQRFLAALDELLRARDWSRSDDLSIFLGLYPEYYSALLDRKAELAGRLENTLLSLKVPGFVIDALPIVGVFRERSG
jgi:hypothetical protein